MVILLSTSTSIIDLINEIASFETFFHCLELKLYYPKAILKIIVWVVSPRNGGLPESKMNMVTPKDQMSQRSSYNLKIKKLKFYKYIIIVNLL